MREGYITQSFVIPRILELCHTQNTLFEADWIVKWQIFRDFFLDIVAPDDAIAPFRTKLLSEADAEASICAA